MNFWHFAKYFSVKIWAFYREVDSSSKWWWYWYKRRYHHFHRVLCLSDHWLCVSLVFKKIALFYVGIGNEKCGKFVFEWRIRCSYDGFHWLGVLWIGDLECSELEKMRLLTKIKFCLFFPRVNKNLVVSQFYLIQIKT